VRAVLACFASVLVALAAAVFLSIRARVSSARDTGNRGAKAGVTSGHPASAGLKTRRYRYELGERRPFNQLHDQRGAAVCPEPAEGVSVPSVPASASSVVVL
jgi:hypothetical protein